MSFRSSVRISSVCGGISDIALRGSTVLQGATAKNSGSVGRDASAVGGQRPPGPEPRIQDAGSPTVSVTDTHEYRCLACEDATVSRDFDVSHLSRTCDACGEFGRFVNTIVLDQLEALEADPPERLHWDSLDRARKFLIAERLTRGDYSIDDFDVTPPADGAGAAEGDDGPVDPTAEASGTDDEGMDADAGESSDADAEETEDADTEETDAAVMERDAANANGAGEGGQ